MLKKCFFNIFLLIFAVFSGSNFAFAQNAMKPVGLNILINKDGFAGFNHPVEVLNRRSITEDINNARSKTLRKDIRVPLKNTMFRIVDSSSSETNTKVADVIDISKNGMLIETSSRANIGEEINIDFEYRDMPFEIQGVVVRVPSDDRAGIKFVNLDTVNSTIILYLSMFDESL